MVYEEKWFYSVYYDNSDDDWDNIDYSILPSPVSDVLRPFVYDIERSIERARCDLYG